MLASCPLIFICLQGVRDFAEFAIFAIFNKFAKIAAFQSASFANRHKQRDQTHLYAKILVKCSKVSWNYYV